MTPHWTQAILPAVLFVLAFCALRFGPKLTLLWAVWILFLPFSLIWRVWPTEP